MAITIKTCTKFNFVTRKSIGSFLLLCSIFMSNELWAQKKPEVLSNKEKDVRAKMLGISHQLSELTPFIVSEVEFSKDQNQKKIAKHITQLKNSFKSLKDHPMMTSSGLSLNRSVMGEQLDQIEALFKQSKHDFARYKLLSALNLCVSCHTQTEHKQIERVFNEKEKDGVKLGVFEKAEYLYITRRYDEALPLYDQYIFEFRKADDDEKLFRAFERKLSYYVRLKRDYKSAHSSFESNLKNKDIPNRVRAEVNDWLKILSGKTLWDNFDAKKITEEEMGKFIQSFIKDNEDGPIFTVTDSTEVLDMDLSSILLEYYNQNPNTKLGAQILYWMAMIDRRLNDDLFYSLGDLYLVQCMEKYPEDPIAKDCFESYLEDMEFIYITKKKKEFPKEIVKKIEGYKKLVKYTEPLE